METDSWVRSDELGIEEPPQAGRQPKGHSIGLGCMRAFLDGRIGDAVDALVAGVDAGILVLDTARAYGDSERAIGEVVRQRAVERARVVTKGGMHREGNVWRPDGRARRLFEDCEASLRALAGVGIDTYLVHAPDPSIPWATTVRALARIGEQKLAKHVGVCNVNRKQLDEAIELAPIAVVQVALGAGQDAAIRSGVVARCIERGIAVMAHSPFGGPKRAPRLARDAVLLAIAKRHGVSPHAIVLSMLLDLHPLIVPIPGATRASTVLDCVSSKNVKLDDDDRAALDARFGLRRALFPGRVQASATHAEVVLVMGLQGAGKSTRAEEYAARGYERLNRDARGGTLRGLHGVLGQRLAQGTTRVVLDNTYTTRAQRFDAIATATAHGAAVRGVWIETPLADAQVNVIERMLAAHGRLLEPREMERAKDPESLSPTALLRTARDSERPGSDEGFTTLEIVAFARRATPRSRRVSFVAFEAQSVTTELERVVFAWQPGDKPRVARDVVLLHCPHDGGPPRCWCRPPFPGLLLAYAAAHDVDLAASVVVGTGPAHEKMAASVGATYVDHSQRR